MSAGIPLTTGNAFRIATGLSTTALSIFLRVRKSAASNHESWAVLVSTSAGSNLDGHGVNPNETGVTEGRSIHGLRFAADVLDIAPVADWAAGSVLGAVSPNVWANLALIFYLDSNVPKLKTALRDHPSGALSTQVQNTNFSMTNALVRFGAGHGAGGTLQGLAADAIIYNTAITADNDILAEFDSQGPNGAAWGSYAFRGEASLAAAAQDESGTSNDLTVEGENLYLSVTDPEFGPTLSGSGQLPEQSTTVTVPNVPTSVAIAGYDSDEISLSFSTNGNAAGTNYEAEYRVSGQPDWVKGAEGQSSPLNMVSLEPDTTYETRVRATNTGGASSYAVGPNQKTQRLVARVYVNQAAAGKVGVTAQVWKVGAGAELAGAPIVVTTGQAFDASPQNDPANGILSAKIDVPVMQVGEPLMRDGDTVRIVLTADAAPNDVWSPILDATVKELD